MQIKILKLFAGLNVAGILYTFIFLLNNRYLPSPFYYDKSDTFFDFFNVLIWARKGGNIVNGAPFILL